MSVQEPLGTPISPASTGTDSSAGASQHRSDQGRRRLTWVGIGALVVALTALWSLAVPLMASPDEPSHVVKAAAVARGQWSGELGPVPTDRSRPGAATTVILPSDYAVVVSLPNCLAFHPETSADCQPAVAPADGTAPVETFAGQYPPLYYLLVGWPSLWLGAEASVYAMRLVSALLAGVLLTWGAYRTWRELPRPALWGVLVAATPMALFLGGTVNPQGLEIAAGFSFFAACLALVRSERGPSTAALVQATVSGALLVNVRTTSPVWAAAIVVAALLVARPGRWSALVRHRGARWAAVAAALASVAAIAWVVLHGAIVTGGGLYPEYANPLRTASAVVQQWSAYLTNMVGDFGWLDTPAPAATLLAWSVAGGALLLLGLTAPASRRSRTGLVLLVLAVAAAPVVFQVPTASDVGLIWQGRYVLPLAVGIPLLAALPLADEPATLTERWRRVLRAVVPVLLVGHVAAFLAASRRYAEGAGGELVTLTPHWSSPVGYLTGVALYAVVATALAVVAWRAARPD